MARKAAVVHLMRWWQLFPKIFPCSYPFFTPLKPIIVAEMSWKLTQVKQKLTWLTFVRSEEDNPFGSVPSNISLYGNPLWGLSKHLLLLGRILVSKWGLRLNIRVQAFAPHNSPSKILIFPSYSWRKNIIFGPSLTHFPSKYKQSFLSNISKLQ